MWANSQELLETIHGAHERLKAKETDAATAHAEARLLSTAAKVMAISLEHARLTGRLQTGSDALPIMRIEATATKKGQRAIDVTPLAVSETSATGK